MVQVDVSGAMCLRDYLDGIIRRFVFVSYMYC